MTEIEALLKWVKGTKKDLQESYRIFESCELESAVLRTAGKLDLLRQIEDMLEGRA